jgi:hypothetical protein
MSVTRTLLRRSALMPITLGSLLALAITASPVGAQTSNPPPQFASGAVTSVHGASVQVSNQAQSSESTVVLSPTTQISKRETAAVSVITVGACVRVVGTGSATKGLTAQTVAVSAASTNGCTGGPGGPGGPGGFRSGNRPRPRDFGNGGGGGNGGFRNGSGTRPANFALASGPVVSVSGDKVVVKSTTFQRPTTSSKSTGKKAKAKATTRPKATTTDVTVTLAASTTVTQTVAASASDVTVGSCVTATGTTASGSVNAERVTVSPPVNGACAGGFGFGGRGGGGSAGAGGGSV